MLVRRKTSSKKVIKKKKPTVPTSFKCLHCGHEKSVECKMEREREIGTLSCRVCGEKFQCKITYLSEPVDVFCEWLDSTVEMNEQDGAD